MIGKRKALSPDHPDHHDSYDGPWSSYAQLFDILKTLSAIIESGDKIERAILAGTDFELQAAVSIYKFESQEFRSRLNSWRMQLGRQENESEEDPLVWDVTSPLCEALPEDSPARILKTQSCFRRPEIAQQLVMSWSGLLLVDGWLPIMQQKGGQFGRAVSLFATDLDHEEVHSRCDSLATNILKSLEYFINIDMGLSNSEFIGFPMTVSMGWWKQSKLDAPELRWYPILLAHMRKSNAGFSGLMRLMAVKGGGGAAYRRMIGQTQGPSDW